MIRQGRCSQWSWCFVLMHRFAVFQGAVYGMPVCMVVDGGSRRHNDVLAICWVSF
ncbi:hypothetical protein XF_1016 [Xylella fastidiosa 9a5c]|uniref:Uncharacterized protein n=1 Tax=Xylella fastidiosa (strain 9a5c) TaxID=160492 RepID=Q9PEL2_XYLFA|nr:hypothetical protein XF_1016 [Xylella fastidiosa 9a5c]